MPLHELHELTDPQFGVQSVYCIYHNEGKSSDVILKVERNITKSGVIDFERGSRVNLSAKVMPSFHLMDPQYEVQCLVFAILKLKSQV